MRWRLRRALGGGGRDRTPWPLRGGIAEFTVGTGRPAGRSLHRRRVRGGRSGTRWLPQTHEGGCESLPLDRGWGVRRAWQGGSAVSWDGGWGQVGFGEAGVSARLSRLMLLGILTRAHKRRWGWGQTSESHQLVVKATGQAEMPEDMSGWGWEEQWPVRGLEWGQPGECSVACPLQPELISLRIWLHLDLVQDRTGEPDRPGSGPPGRSSLLTSHPAMEKALPRSRQPGRSPSAGAVSTQPPLLAQMPPAAGSPRRALAACSLSPVRAHSSPFVCHLALVPRAHSLLCLISSARWRG